MTKEAFLSLILPLQVKLFRFAYHLLQNEEEAKDIIQEVMMRLWLKRIDLDKIENLEAWCIKLTKNVIIDKIRLEKRKRNDNIKPDSIVINSTMEKSEQKDMVAMTRKLFDALPEKQKLLLILRDIEGLSYQDISIVMELNLGEVKIGIFRARKMIREKLILLSSYGLQ